MKKFGIIIGAIVVLLVGQVLLFPANSWRYRFTMEIETPEGVRTGSVVRQVHVGTGMKIGDSSGANMFMRGEALAVDLGERGVLFALLNRDQNVDYGGYIVFEAFPYPGSKSGPLGGIATSEGIAYYSSLTGKAEVPVDKLPTLVRFRDISDSKTVELVDPNNLSKSLGIGVKLKSATIEMVNKGIWPLNALSFTGEPVTAKIEGILPWISNFKGTLGGKFDTTWYFREQIRWRYHHVPDLEFDFRFCHVKTIAELLLK
jgi:hypothetical protein